LDLGDGELAPISTSNFLDELLVAALPAREQLEVFFRYRPRREVYSRAPFGDDKVRMAGFDEAEEGVRRGLRGFLSYRFAGLKMDRQARPRAAASGRGVVAGGLQVEVSCRTPGLRIHISSAYFVNWVYFGSPTTPVTSYVLPGRYIFCGDGPMVPTRKLDPGVFCIPPTYRACLARF
jgi:hypothetical protein